jgi:thiosulfate/3-mercaptopyruvate sulfurtransferase
MKGNRVRQLVIFIMITLFAMLLVASGKASRAEAATLVDVDWLEANLGRKDMRIVDVRPDVREYWQGHIPGAVYFSIEAVRLADQGIPVKLTPPEILTQMLGRMGITPKSMVVVYGDTADPRATYLTWALDYLGHDSSAVLEGGFTFWKQGEKPITQDDPEIVPVRYLVPVALQEQDRASLGEVEEVVRRQNGIILDVRPHDLYTGEKGFWKRNGHIKGAVNHFYRDDFKEDGSWKSVDELRKSYDEQGVTPDKTIIVSCGSGLMAADTYFTLKYILGYPQVKLYDGSYSEWSNFDYLPIQTGDK